jgi:glutamyl-Q tRNA(Asp) synthetase
MEDLDPPRESIEAADQILRALECLNLFWDGEVLYQSQRHDAYREALLQVQDQDYIFPCTCSRQKIKEHAGIYPGTCRKRKLDDADNDADISTGNYALRCRVSDSISQFEDVLQGRHSQNLETDSGDFIVKRKDGLYSYQLAVVVDDAFQNISHIIRGIDLIDSTHRQIYLQKLLQFPQPVYGHIPVIINSLGQKLSKQHHAKPIDLTNPALTLYQALIYLQQKPPVELSKQAPADILEWAVNNWKIHNLHDLQQLEER